MKMSSFTEPLLLEDISGTDYWRVGRDLVYHAGQLPSREVYVVPRGFCTDLASIPRPLWAVVGHPAGPYRAAAVLHDWLYAVQVTTRQRADDLFLESMAVLNVDRWRRMTLWLGVRSGGWVAWRKHAKANAKLAQDQRRRP